MDVRAFLLRLIAADAGLRDEDEKKAKELTGLLEVVAPLVRNAETIVDAAAGKGYVGLALATQLGAKIVFLERNEKHVRAIRSAADHLGLSRVEAHAADVGDLASWPPRPDVVIALHACGDASDKTIAAAVACNAKHILVIPCCVAADLPAARRADARAASIGVPRHAEVRRRFVEACVLGERVLTLEAAGWETTTVPFVPPTVTPYNVLLRARRVEEPTRMREAAVELARLRGES